MVDEIRTFKKIRFLLHYAPGDLKIEFSKIRKRGRNCAREYGNQKETVFLLIFIGEIL
jgi:hypothetical protein